MKIKEYEAHTLKDGLLQVRQDMGPDAVILETRKLRKGGLLGVGSHDAVRIVAAIGITVDEPRTAPATAQAPARPAVAHAEVAQSLPRVAQAPCAQGTAASTAPRVARTNSGPMVARAFGAAVADRPADASSGDPAAARAAAALNAMAGSLRRQAPAGAGVQSATPRARQVASMPVPQADRPLAPPVPAPANAPDRPAVPETDPISVTRLEREIGDIKTTLESMRQVLLAAAPGDVMAVVHQQEPVAGPFQDLEDRLVRADVPASMAHELVDGLPDVSGWSTEARPHMAEAALKEVMASRISRGGPILLTPGRTKAVALVGPVGVGKTTTIAKLAAHYALVEKRKVALVTMDTYRIAAVEQLKTYGQIIDLPVRVVYSPVEIQDALQSFADYDLVLIDTAGRSQKNSAQIGEVKAMVEGAGCETYLVLSASTRERDLDDQVQRFSEARVDRLVFTKLDETNTFGTLYSVAARHRIPVSYLTTGQKVPEDIEIATGARLAQLALGGVEE